MQLSFVAVSQFTISLVKAEMSGLRILGFKFYYGCVQFKFIGLIMDMF